ncbi:MAG: WD40 repeat domain-containing protein [Leptolyngbyaceae cyanobacterium]
MHTLSGHRKAVSSVAISPDGKYAVSASDDKTLILWNLISGQYITCFYGDWPFYHCAIAPDGVSIVAGDQGGNVHFFYLLEE